MSIDITFRALKTWPKSPTKERKRAPFKSPYNKTIDLLEGELAHLGVREAIIEADCERSEIRLDGHLRSGAKLRGPGVVLRFESKAGAMTFPCDTFSEWPDNIRAIALALEALRKVDRYGVTSSGEQYRGWLGLPDKSQTGAFADEAAALQWLEQTVGVFSSRPWDSATIASVRKAGIMRCHPDRNGGNQGTWKLWQQAAAVLGIEV